MGQAKRRGTYEQRLYSALGRSLVAEAKMYDMWSALSESPSVNPEVLRAVLRSRQGTLAVGAPPELVVRHRSGADRFEPLFLPRPNLNLEQYVNAAVADNEESATKDLESHKFATPGDT